MKNRIEYIDVAKGITILLVVLGHVDAIPSPIKSMIYSFHMPIFFLLSGYFLKDESLQNAFRKMWRSLIIPYFVVGAIMRLCQVIINAIQGNPFDCVDILALFGVTWKFGKGTDMVSVGAIWFLIVLFWSKLYLQVILKKKFGLLLLILLANCSVFITWAFGIVLPFGIQQALVCALFVYVGYQCNEIGLFERKIPTIPFVLFFLSVILFTRSFAIATRANEYKYGLMSVVISVFISVLVVIAVKKFCGCKILFVNNFLSWCGRNSIIILAVHSIEARYICELIPFPNWYVEILVRVAYVLALSYLCVKSRFIRKVFNIKSMDSHPQLPEAIIK